MLMDWYPLIAGAAEFSLLKKEMKARMGPIAKQIKLLPLQ